MTGYLHALGSLAVGHAPALRPRPRSLFEPGNPGAVDGWPGEIDIERVAPAPRPRTRPRALLPAQPDVAPRPVVTRTAVAPVLTPPHKPEPEREPQPAPASVRQPPAPVIAPASHAPDVPAPPSPVGDPARPALLAHPAAAPHASVEPPPTRPAIHVTTATTATDTPAPTPAEPRRERTMVESRQVVERVVREVVRDTEPRPVAQNQAVRPLPVLTTPARAAAPAPRTTAPPPPTPEPAPVIHVSVGRVEVRAVSPRPRPEPPRAPAAAPAGPPLDEYLAGLGGHR